MGPLSRGGGRQVYVPTPPFPGEPTRYCVNLIRYKLGQVSPRTQERWNMAHGRHLAGLGGNETEQPWDPEFRSEAMEQLEAEDDVHGSGIFDSYGRAPTVNHELGVFADHPSLPGFIDREVQYAVSKDIYDITSGADVVTVAGGGMSYQERGGLPVPFDWQGRKPLPPPRALPPPTSRTQGYVSLLPQAPSPVGPARQPVFRPLPGGARRGPVKASPVLRLPTGPARAPFVPVPMATGREIPMRALPTVALPSATGARGLQVPMLAPFSRLPMSVVPQPIMSRGTAQVAMPSVMLGVSSPRLLPMSVSPQVVGRTSTVMTGVPGQAVAAATPTTLLPSAASAMIAAAVAAAKPAVIRTPAPSFTVSAYGPPAQPSAVATKPLVSARGLGADDSAAPGWGTYLFAGLLVGSAAAMFFGATKIRV